MRRRLVLAATPLLVLLVLAIAVPAAVAAAAANTTAVVRDRGADAARFASALLTAPDVGLVRLRAELDDYARLYDTPVWLVDRDGAVRHASDPTTEPPREAAEEVQAVLTGRTPAEPGPVWPWGPGRLPVVTPVGYDSQVVAAVVMDVPTDRARRATATTWALLAGLGLAPTAVAFALLWPMSRWVLRPVAQLERVAVGMAAGDLSARAGADRGPPELRSLARSFNTMADAVGDTVTRQRRFVADASHQLRTPLAGVRLSVENLAHHLDDDPDAAASYDDTLSGIDAMTAMVTGLLAATRAEAAATRHRVVAVDAALDGLSRRWAEPAAAAGVALAVDVAPGAAAEPTGGLPAAVDELVHNALRLSGGSRVVVRGHREGPWYRLSVTDDGVGIDEAELALATQRFWRAPRSLAVPGTGLGLGIVERTVTDAGGRLELSRPDGGGLRVGVVLPAADAPADAPDTAGG